MARVIVVAERETDPQDHLDGDRRTFQFKERVTAADARDPHVAAQLIERNGWACADAEDVEFRQAARPEPPGRAASHTRRRRPAWGGPEARCRDDARHPALLCAARRRSGVSRF